MRDRAEINQVESISWHERWFAICDNGLVLKYYLQFGVNWLELSLFVDNDSEPLDDVVFHFTNPTLELVDVDRVDSRLKSRSLDIDNHRQMRSQ